VGPVAFDRGAAGRSERAGPISRSAADTNTCAAGRARLPLPLWPNGTTPRWQQPLTGWFGHAAPFAFSDDYAPAPGIEQLQCGTSPVLGLAALEVGVDLIAEIGVGRLHAKSQALSEFFLECLGRSMWLDLVSPPASSDRGSQLSFRHPAAYALCQALIARGVIGDFRDPDVLRLGFAPAYLSFADMAAAARHLSEVLASGEWQRPEFNRRAAVT
jgi:kynureninase